VEKKEEEEEEEDKEEEEEEEEGQRNCRLPFNNINISTMFRTER